MSIARAFEPQPERWEDPPPPATEPWGQLVPPRRRPPTAVGTEMLPPEPPNRGKPRRQRRNPSRGVLRRLLGLGLIGGGIALAMPISLGTLVGLGILVPTGLLTLRRSVRKPRLPLDFGPRWRLRRQAAADGAELRRLRGQVAADGAELRRLLKAG